MIYNSLYFLEQPKSNFNIIETATDRCSSYSEGPIFTPPHSPPPPAPESAYDDLDDLSLPGPVQHVDDDDEIDIDEK